MTADIDILNRALAAVGTRSTVQSFSEISNEALNGQLLYANTRDDVLRSAPWGCAVNTDLLGLLKAVPGTPENPGPGATTWTKAYPPPPWAYEYAYPEDCLRVLNIVPQFATGFAGGIPITTAVTGTPPGLWNGPPVRFKIAVDQDDNNNDIKVILTNQEQAIVQYIKQVTDPNVWDSLLQSAVTAGLAAQLAISLTGDKTLAEAKLKEANAAIMMARAADGNEGLTIIDNTPDWIRVRGITYPAIGAQSNNFDWGPTLTFY